MAAIYTIAALYAHDIKFEPHKMVIVWKFRDKWRALSAFRDPSTCRFSIRDMEEIKKALDQDEYAIALNCRVCETPRRGTSVTEMANWIRQKYDAGENLLKDEIK